MHVRVRSLTAAANERSIMTLRVAHGAKCSEHRRTDRSKASREAEHSVCCLQVFAAKCRAKCRGGSQIFMHRTD